MYNPNGTLWLPEVTGIPVPAEPGVYYVVKDKQLGWKLERRYDRFMLPTKLYGKIVKYGEHIWNAYIRRNKTISALFTGLKGSGKTELGSYIANKAIDNGMIVVMITEIRADPELIAFISKLTNAVIFMDEFGKIFNGGMQNQILTMLNDLGNTKKLFILTENNTNMLNRFLLDRPGRIWYHVKFDRLEEDVVREYCEDMNCEKEFTEELLSRYSKSPTFVFDHLKAIVTEHLEYRDLNFSELLELMNISILEKKIKYRVISVENIEHPEYRYTVLKPVLDKKTVFHDFGFTINVMREDEDNENPQDEPGFTQRPEIISLPLNVNSIERYIDNNIIVYKYKNFRVTIKEEEEDK